MSFSPSFLEEIRNRLPLSGVIGSRVRMTRAGREFKGCCPFHHEKTPSFYVNDDKQFYHCFGCGAHGDVIGFVMHHDHLSFPEAVELLAGQAGLQVPRDTPMERERFDEEKRLYLLLEKVTTWFEDQLFAPAGREGLGYLRGRGLSDDAIRRFRLGYAPNDSQALLRAMTAQRSECLFSIDDLVAVGLAKKSEDRSDHFSFFRNRVIFPVSDRRGRTVAFGARILGDGEPKYLNSPDHAMFHKGQLLYGLSRARTALSQGQPIVVVEGYMDVIALVEAGFSGAVAPLGTALTEDQMKILWKLLPPPESREASRDYSPILCFDGDNAGLRAAARAVDRALPLITSVQTLRVATITGAKDPDELLRKSGKGAFEAILKQAQPMIDVMWNLALAGRQIRTPEERGAFTGVLKRRVAQIQDEQLRELYRNELKKRIDDAFGWKPRTMSRSGSGAPAAAPFLGARHAPQMRQRVKEKVFLALMINHPALFDAYGEDFARIDFGIPKFERLRQKITEILSETESPLTSEELRRALAPEHGFSTETDDREVLSEVLAPETFVGLAKAARPDATTEEAAEAWKAMQEVLDQERVKAEYAAACARYRDDPSEDNQKRKDALRERVLQFFRTDDN